MKFVYFNVFFYEHNKRYFSFISDVFIHLGCAILFNIPHNKIDVQ